MIGKEGRPASEYSSVGPPPGSVVSYPVISRSQIPVLETGKGSGVEHAPTSWMTSGGKVRLGGTSIIGTGVSAHSC